MVLINDFQQPGGTEGGALIIACGMLRLTSREPLVT